MAGNIGILTEEYKRHVALLERQAAAYDRILGVMQEEDSAYIKQDWDDIQLRAIRSIIEETENG